MKENSSFVFLKFNHHIELKPLSILSEKMDSIKDTLKNCKSIKNSDEILDELFSSIKVRYNYSTIFNLYSNFYFIRKRKGLTKKVRTRTVKIPVMKRKRGKNTRKVRRRKRNKRRKRRNISEEVITVRNERRNL